MGFKIELVQQLENGNTVYAGHGFRVVKMKTDSGRIEYQLRVKDAQLLEWRLFGTFSSTSEIRRKLTQLGLESEEKSFHL